MLILANQTQRPLSEILKIKNSYIAYCVDEVAYYIWIKHKERIREQKEFEESMKKHSVKKKRK